MKTVLATLRVEPDHHEVDIEVPVDVPAAHLVERLYRGMQSLGLKKSAAKAFMLIVGLEPRTPYLNGGDTVADGGLVDGGYLRLVPCEPREATYVVPSEHVTAPMPPAAPAPPPHAFVVAYRSRVTGLQAPAAASRKIRPASPPPASQGKGLAAEAPVSAVEPPVPADEPWHTLRPSAGEPCAGVGEL